MEKLHEVKCSVRVGMSREEDEKSDIRSLPLPNWRYTPKRECQMLMRFAR